MIFIAGKAERKPSPGERLIDRAFLSGFKKQHGMRRADFYTAMIVSAALEAAEDSCFRGTLPEETGILIAGRFGPQNTTAKFLDELLEYPEDQLLSTAFTHSVHNAAASYVAELLHLTGPVFTMTHTGETVPDGSFATAKACLETGYCARLLLLAVRESGYIDENLRRRRGTGPVTPEGARERAAGYLLTIYENESKYTLTELPELRIPEKGEFSHGENHTGRN